LIKKMQEEGLSQVKISKRLKVSRGTLIRYLKRTN
jgi:transposase